MDPISVVTHTGKLLDGDRARTALHALTHRPLDESRPRKTIRRALKSICESFDWKSGLVFWLDEQSKTQTSCGRKAVDGRFYVLSAIGRGTRIVAEAAR